MKRTLALATTIAVGAVALVAGVTPADAGTGGVPGNSDGCGNRSGAYTACVTVSNETRGFSGPGQTSRAAGLAFVGSGLDAKGHTAAAVWAFDRSEFAPAAGWLAGRCRTNSGILNGCDLYFNMTLAATATATGSNRTLQQDIIHESHNRAISFHGWQYYKKNNTAGEGYGHSCSSGNRFVSCQYVNESGIKDYRRFNYRLTNETVTVKITNFIDQRLVLTHNPRWGGLVSDARGETPSIRLANRELNSSRSIAPYLDGDSLPQAYWGALRPVDDDETTLLLEYRYQRGHGREGDTYTDNTVTLRLRIEKNGRPDTKGTTCVVGGRSAFSRVICTIEGLSYSGHNTEVAISLGQ